MYTLRVMSREAGTAKELRREGVVPGVVYGPSIESQAVSIARRDLQVLFSKITRSSRIELSLDDGSETKEMDVFVKSVDYDPIRDEPIHVDFYHPDVGHPLSLDVPVKVTGEAIGTKSGGILSVMFNTIPVHGLSKNMLPLITIDVSRLDLGDSVHVRDIDFGDVEPLLPPERTVVSVLAPRGMGLAEEVEGEELEGEELEGEGAEAGEGAATESAEETSENE